MITGIALLPPLHEHQNENDCSDDDESEDNDIETDEVIRSHLQAIAMTSHQCQADFDEEPPQEDEDNCNNNNNNNDEDDAAAAAAAAAAVPCGEQEEPTNCLSSSSAAAAGGNNSTTASSAAVTRHDLSCPTESDLANNNNNSSIINGNNTNSSQTEANFSHNCNSPELSSLDNNGVILRSPSVVLTTNMALDSFRRSVCLESDANIDLDAILNDLESLTQMLKSELRPVPPTNEASTQQQPHKLAPVPEMPLSPATTSSLPRSGSGDSGSCCPSQATFLPAFSSGVELRRKQTSTSGVSPTKGVVVDVHHNAINQHQHTSWNSADFSDHSNQQHQPSPPSAQGNSGGSNRASMGDSDSAFSESGSTPTGSAGTGNGGGSNGSVANSHQQLIGNSSPTSQISAMTTSVDDEATRLAKEEKIRIALEKIREAQIRKLCIRIFGPDETTSKTLFIDETTTVRQVIHLLAAKNHVEPNVNWSVVEYYPDLYVHRVIEDHESLVGNMLLWKPDSPNCVRFEMRPEKYDLFARPEVYLTSNGDDDYRQFHHSNADHVRRLQLVQECFSDISVRLPHLEMSLHLKHPTKKSWRKLTFFMRGSGLYYTTKSKGKASAKDLVCLAQFEHVNLYVCTADYQKKFKAPTPFGFVLKHPQLQKRCKYVHYLCADTEQDLTRWCMCIRLAKYGKQLAENYATLAQDIAAWPAERGLSAAGLLQKVTGLPAPVVTPLRHSFTPSVGSGATLTDDRATPSSAIMSTSAAARLAASAEQLAAPSELLQHYQQHRLNQYHQQQQQSDYESVSANGSSNSSNSPRPPIDDQRPLSPMSKPPNGKKKHIRFSDDPDSLLSDHLDSAKQCDQQNLYDTTETWRQGEQVVFPPPPPLLCHDYDTIAERPVPQQQRPYRALSPRNMSSPLPPEQQNVYDIPEGRNGATSPQQQPPTVVLPPVSHSEMQYGIIVKPPVPAKPRHVGPLSPRSGDGAKPAPPPRTTSSSTNGSRGLQKNAVGTSSAGNLTNGGQTTNRALVDITGELDKLLSARAARLERLWNQEDDTVESATAQTANNNAYPLQSSILMASQDLTSEETGTIKKRPPPPPRRTDQSAVAYHHQY